MILAFWFWFTPIFYSAERFPPGLLFLLRWNPMAHVVTAYRDCLLRMAVPNLRNLALLAAVSFVVFVADGAFFRHTKREFEDVL